MRLTTACVFLYGATANAQTAPLQTKFESTASHADIAARVCAMNVTATVDGVYRSIEIRVLDDSSVLCDRAPQNIDAVHATIRMTTDVAQHPSEIVLEIEVPQDASPSAIDDLRAALRDTAIEIEHRVRNAPQQPAPVPMHAVQETNWELIGVGVGGLVVGWGISAILGIAISSSQTDPGTAKTWPYIPFIGAVAFSASYKESYDCYCSLGRAVSVVGSVLIDAVQVVGLVSLIVGVTTPHTRMVRDAVWVSMTPNGASLGVRF